MGKLVNTLEESAIGVLLAAMVIVTFTQVVARYGFNSGAVWALELTTYLFAWMVLFGMSYGVKVGAHLGVDAFVKMLPSGPRRLCGLLVVAACVGYGVILFLGAWEYWSKMYRFGIDTEDLYVPRVLVEWWTSHSGDAYEEVPIDRWVPYMILPIGLALITFRFLQAGWGVVTGVRDGILVSDEAADSLKQHEQDGVSGTSR